jgi:hypothetical protein
VPTLEGSKRFVQPLDKTRGQDGSVRSSCIGWILRAGDYPFRQWKRSSPELDHARGGIGGDQPLGRAQGVAREKSRPGTKFQSRFSAFAGKPPGQPSGGVLLDARARAIGGRAAVEFRGSYHDVTSWREAAFGTSKRAEKK